MCCTEQQFESLTTQVAGLASTCASCKVDLANFFCQSTCNPSNSLFIKPLQVRKEMGDPNTHPGQVFHAFEDVNYYLSADMARDVYDFCSASQIFKFICKQGSCFSGFDLLKFTGEFRLNALGSPFGINFLSMEMMEDQEQVCSCEEFENNPKDCIRPLDSRLQSCFGVCGSICDVESPIRNYTSACYGQRTTTTVGTRNGDSKSTDLTEFWTILENIMHAESYDYNILIGVIATIAIVLILLWCVYQSRQLKKASDTEIVDTAHTSQVSVIDAKLAALLQKMARCIARGNMPYFVIILSLALVGFCSYGLTKMETETEPVKLWVSESSVAHQNRDRYGKLFMPFYRTEQVIMAPIDGGIIGRVEYIEEAIRLQEAIANLRTGYYNESFPQGVTLSDICWKATGNACTVNSITQYFQNSMERFLVYKEHGLVLEHLSNCLASPALLSDVNVCSQIEDRDDMDECPCFSNFGAPMDQYKTYVGGFPQEAPRNPVLFANAKAMLSTALVFNFYESEMNELAIFWERDYIKFLKQENQYNEYFDLSFMAEISVQDEIKVESDGDTLPAVLSYILMLVYVTIGLGKWGNSKTFWREAKFSVGFAGVFVIICSVAGTIGFFSWLGVKVQLIIMEVVPFLTLAIGVDNIFLIVHAVNRAQKEFTNEKVGVYHTLSEEERVRHIVGRVISQVGPGIVMASIAESIAFAFGCLSPMPIVLWFAAFSVVAVLFNLVLQLTVFVAIVTLDKRRELHGKSDIFCCVQIADDREDDTMSKNSNVSDRVVEAYARFLGKPVVQALVLISWVVAIAASCYSIQSLKPGLPQQESMPSASYMVDYFNALDEHLATGPPIYFVVESGYGNNPISYNFSNREVEAKFCDSKSFCNSNSIPNIVKNLGSRPELSRISPGTTYSWLDELWGFADPSGACCRVVDETFFPPGAVNENATSCLASDIEVPSIPDDKFMPMMNMFATASAGKTCPFGGGSIFQGQFSINNAPIPIVSNSSKPIQLQQSNNDGQVTAFSYMTLSEACPTQHDYIETYRQANRISEYISETTGVSVWPYSIFFVFFDQYLTIEKDTIFFVSSALGSIFLVHAAYYLAFWIPFLVTLVIASVCVCILGLMTPLGIMLNGLSVVNLIIAAGISVEFCSHLARAFAGANGTGQERMTAALRKVLLSVFFGITITKIVGLSALTLADSRIFQKYYFRMYMAVVLCGVFHGLVILPILLNLTSSAAQKRVQSASTADYDEASTPNRVA